MDVAASLARIQNADTRESLTTLFARLVAAETAVSGGDDAAKVRLQALFTRLERVEQALREKESGQSTSGVDDQRRAVAPEASAAAPVASAAPAAAPPAAAAPVAPAAPAPPAAPVAPAAPAAASSAPTMATFSLAELKAPGPYPAGVDAHERENYLSDADFRAVFGVDKAAFGAQAKWKRDAAKKKADLF